MKAKDPTIYPLGSRVWILGSELSMCGDDKDKEVTLTLSKCYPDKYTCNSGHCIPLRYK